MQPIAGMLLNPFLHDQSFVNQLGKREKLACFRAKQPVIIAISQAGPAASIPTLSSFRAYYELITSSFPGPPNATSPPDQSPPTRPIPSASAVQDRAARSDQKPSQPAVLLSCLLALQARNCALWPYTNRNDYRVISLSFDNLK